MTYTCFAWKLAADTCHLKLQRMHKVLRTIGNLAKATKIGHNLLYQDRTDRGLVYMIYTIADSPALPGYLFILRSIVAVDISVVTEPLPSYQQFLIVAFHGYESCTRCLATAKLEHTYFIRYFGPLGRMPHFSLLILFLILRQSGKRGK
jgi:hypothetical protein